VKIPRSSILLSLLLAAPGCGGGYILTVPDQVAPAGRDAVAVVRLQRSEIALFALPVSDALIHFQAGDGLQRGAYTDKQGYAGTTVPAPSRQGRHVFRVGHMDKDGDEIFREAPFYSWDANRPAVAVDLDCLPPRRSAAAQAARDGLQRLAANRNICYVTRRPVASHPAAHMELQAGGYPDGPVLLWQQQLWRVVREGTYQFRVVVEPRLVSQLSVLRRALPRLDAGVTDSASAAKGFADAGLRVFFVGSATAPGAVTRLTDWNQLGKD
jgi:hypothetical protein